MKPLKSLFLASFFDHEEKSCRRISVISSCAQNCWLIQRFLKSAASRPLPNRESRVFSGGGRLSQAAAHVLLEKGLTP
jgi:hypothetical protein